MLKTPILSYLLRHTVYLYVGIICIGSFSLIDLYFVSRIGTDELTALGYASPVVLWVLSFLLGIGTGITTVVARCAVGNGKGRLRSSIRTAGMLSLGVGMVLMALGFGLHNIVFNLLQADAGLRPLIADYLYILYLGFIVLSLLIGILSTERALGRNRSITIVLAVVVVLNLILDPILIFGRLGFPALGLRGAAWASVIALSIGLGTAFYISFRLRAATKRDLSISESVDPPVQRRPGGWEMLYIGLPVALTNAVFPVAVGFITGLLSTFGSDAVAAYGVANRVDLLVMLFITAQSATLAPFVTQNWTAGRVDRVWRSIRLSVLIAALYCAAVLVVLMSTRVVLAELFTDQNRVIAYLDLYYRIVPWGYFPGAVAIFASNTLVATGFPMQASILNLVHLLLIYIPTAYGLSGMFQVGGVFAAYPLAALPVALAGVGLVRNRLR